MHLRAEGQKHCDESAQRRLYRWPGQVDWVEAALEKTRKLRKGGRLGPGGEDSSEILFVNRVIRWTSIGINYEADPRHAERLLEGLALDSGCKTTASPGIKLLVDQLKEDVKLPVSGFTGFRG